MKFFKVFFVSIGLVGVVSKAESYYSGELDFSLTKKEKKLFFVSFLPKLIVPYFPKVKVKRDTTQPGKTESLSPWTKYVMRLTTSHGQRQRKLSDMTLRASFYVEENGKGTVWLEPASSKLRSISYLRGNRIIERGPLEFTPEYLRLTEGKVSHSGRDIIVEGVAIYFFKKVKKKVI